MSARIAGDPDVPAPAGGPPDAPDHGSAALATNIAHFARALRRAGLRVGPADTIRAVEAVEAAGIGTREEFYWTLHATLVTRREDTPTFDEAFRLFWRSRDLVAKMIELLSPAMRGKDTDERRKAGSTRAAQALAARDRTWESERERPEIEIDARFSASGREVLRTKDFAQMTAEELAMARQAIRSLVLPDDRVLTRRRERAPRGRIDRRATLRRAARTGGDLVVPIRARPREVEPPVIVLADISGSMSQYTRLFLHFVHALAASRGGMHTFLFGTRLTDVTRPMRGTDPDEAVERVSGLVADWAGGTRIAGCLEEFNRQWSRRVLGGRSTVLLVTDGLEREDPDELARQAERLGMSCRRLIWLNPLLRFEGFEPRAGGVRALLPHVDEFRAVHSLGSIAELCDALSGDGARNGARNGARGRKGDPRPWLARLREAA